MSSAGSKTAATTSHWHNNKLTGAGWQAEELAIPNAARISNPGDVCILAGAEMEVTGRIRGKPNVSRQRRTRHGALLSIYIYIYLR